MPTAVEHSIFAFLKIDDAALNLSERNANAFFLKIEGDHKAHQDIATTGDFLKIQGHGLTEIAGVALKIDEFVVKLTNADTIGSATGGAGAGKVLVDFLKLDQSLGSLGGDLKILGADFLKLHNSMESADHKTSLTNVLDDFLKIEGELKIDEAAFLKLSQEILPNSDARVSSLDNAYKELGGELKIAGAAFGTIAADFLDLSEALHGGGGGAGFGSGGGGGAGFVALGQDFLKLDEALGGANSAAGQLIGLLLPAVQKGTT